MAKINMVLVFLFAMIVITSQVIAQSPSLLFVLDRTTVTGGVSVKGAITITSSGQNDVKKPSINVQLSADNPAIVKVPQLIKISEGKSFEYFEIQTVQPKEVEIVTIKASYGKVVKEATLRVLPFGEVLSVFLDPPFISKKRPEINLVVNLVDPSPPGGTAIQLISSHPKAVKIPHEIVVPEGKLTSSLKVKFLTETSEEVHIFVKTYFDAYDLPLRPTPPSAPPPTDTDLYPEIYELSPDVVTDGQTVCIYGDFPPNWPGARIVLRGYKYLQPPLYLDPQNEDPIFDGTRECIYCGCIPVVITDTSRICFTVPFDVPSGEYEVFVLPLSNECLPGGPVAPGQETCPDHNLTCPSDKYQSTPIKLYVLISIK